MHYAQYCLNDIFTLKDNRLKVYKGFLESGVKVAIKRAAAESLQGANEFRNEIELLSRVHHRNLVGLIGFCFEEGEQMLVYEFMPNGTMRESLTGNPHSIGA